MATRRSNIIGLSWKKLTDKAKKSKGVYDNLTEDDASSPAKRDPLRERCGNQIRDASAKKLKRSASFRKAITSFGQKLKKSTSRKKDLLTLAEVDDDCYHRLQNASTPVRRSPRIAAQTEREEKMYSPFRIDTPGKTPIRMGTTSREPKRFNFSSPRTFEKDLDEVNNALQSLHQINQDFENLVTRSTRRQTLMIPQPTRIRTVPLMGTQTPTHRRRSCQPQPVFV